MVRVASVASKDAHARLVAPAASIVTKGVMPLMLLILALLALRLLSHLHAAVADAARRVRSIGELNDRPLLRGQRRKKARCRGDELLLIRRGQLVERLHHVEDRRHRLISCTLARGDLVKLPLHLRSLLRLAKIKADVDISL